MDVDVLQLSLLQLDDSPKDELRSKPRQSTRQEPTASDKPPVPRRAPSRPATPSTVQEKSTLLTTEEVAAVLHVHPRTVQRLVARGQLAAIRLGSAVRFDPRDLGNLITNHKERRAGQPPSTPGRLRATRRAGVSFADRLRSEAHEHRAARA
jgi:excisionase family DNA binding protein